ncbi:uncharacterized protein LOC131663051 [Phymastichus coffea]|uniref:uncharacterized protein LOC131663051 n=1 Tax=Phymastichus coffea TaxID=108790 RepID=UPI00273ADC89|nr:uncharacterized protein LOC131663051 [Phymastichus coffea]
MPRKKIVRTPEEQEAFLQNQRRQRAERQRIRRQQMRQNVNDSNRLNQHSVENNINTQSSITLDYLSKLDVACKHCHALHFKDEMVQDKGLSFNDCCGHGAVLLDPLLQFPKDLETLLKGEHRLSVLFFDHIRAYNNSLSFASFNANLVNFQSRRLGPYCFKIQGQVYYQINTSLYPCNNETPSYGQLFIIDQDEAVNYRMNTFSALNQDINLMLDTIIRENNIFAQSYNMMRQEIEIQQALFNETHQPQPALQLLFSLKPGQDVRRYNIQRANEVAAIFSTTADGEIPESYVSIRNKNMKSLQFVSTMDPNVEPWVYPLFYPYGSSGWHRNLMRQNSNRRVTRTAYHRFHMAIRENEFNPFILGRRLFQQWVVDSYVKIEKDRIQYHKDHQKEIRADTYQGLKDYVQKSADAANGQVGKTVILPSTFLRSPRYMQQCYQDAMAIVNEKGKPDIFLTTTCNPNWKEIKENLLPGQQACDRPDLVARVFHLKKNRLIELVTKKKLFGEVASWVYVVEFQKRGLPHMHLLITLAAGHKWFTAEIIDKFISAEIPDKIKYPRLHDIVINHMIHGPCGDWCVKDGKCSKHFPKPFQSETNMDENGFPDYRRRNDGITYEKTNNHIVDNSWVVPYCAILLEMFDCHINVEAVSSISAVKYLYKYIYKGHDAATVIIQDSQNGIVIEHDEICQCLDARYVGPVEACYRILSKLLQDKSHTVIRLPVHLANEQNIIFSESCDELNLEDYANVSSMLMDYFKLNQDSEIARQYYYTQIPGFFVYEKKKVNGIYESKWKTRQNHFNTIGRMFSVSPAQLELFQLRLLLLHIKGATSFQYLRTVNNIIYPTFTAACLALGLIENDNEWDIALSEGVKWMMPQRFRFLFARILIHCQPVLPEKLWETYQDALSEDFSRNHQKNIAHQMAYSDINRILNNEGKSLTDFPSMPPLLVNNINEEITSLQEMADRGQEKYNNLNTLQKKIVDLVNNAVTDENYNGPTCIFMEGPGGSGKTYVYETMYDLLTSKNVEVCTMAFTGIAATLLPNGKTCHKIFGLPVPMFNDSTSHIKAQSKEAEKFRKIKVFIWDEAPMAPRYALDIANKLLQYIMGNNLPFGGKIMVLDGDFKQLLPIKVRGTRNETLNLSIKYSSTWPYFKIFKLTTNMRVLPNEIEFSNFLLDIGNGTLTDKDDFIDVPQHCILSSTTKITEGIFGDLIRDKKYDEMSSCAILSARNEDVDKINIQITNLLDPTNERLYTAIDSVVNNNNGEMDEIIMPEYLNSLNPSCLPPYKLNLKINCIVMLIRNISINEGLCNGTRLQIIDLSNHLLKCKILTDYKMPVNREGRVVDYTTSEEIHDLMEGGNDYCVEFTGYLLEVFGRTKVGKNEEYDLFKAVITNGHLRIMLLIWNTGVIDKLTPELLNHRVS